MKTPLLDGIAKSANIAEMKEKYGITETAKARPDHSVHSIGWAPESKKWYGWSHRAIHGFGVGSKVKKGDCGYIPSKGEWTAQTIDDAKQMAIDFAEGVS